MPVAATADCARMRFTPDLGTKVEEAHCSIDRTRARTPSWPTTLAACRSTRTSLWAAFCPETLGSMADLEWGSGGREFESRRPDQSNQAILARTFRAVFVYVPHRVQRGGRRTPVRLGQNSSLIGRRYHRRPHVL